MSSSAMQGGHKYWNNRIDNCAALRVWYETTNTLRLVRRRRVLALRPLSLSLSLSARTRISVSAGLISLILPTGEHRGIGPALPGKVFFWGGNMPS